MILNKIPGALLPYIREVCGSYSEDQLIWDYNNFRYSITTADI